PPFVRATRDPGYVKGYPPGIRENGGQYTHAAIWAIMAFAALGDGDRAGELFALLNPINHTSTRAGLYRYRVEPYVVAGDVYAEVPHSGRGGWTWYSGSAGWMYRAGIEWLLGFRIRGAALFLDPCIPRTWTGFSITFRYHASRYEVQVENPHGFTRGISRVEIDGVPAEGGRAALPLVNDGATHHVRVWLGWVARSAGPSGALGAEQQHDSAHERRAPEDRRQRYGLLRLLGRRDRAHLEHLLPLGVGDPFIGETEEADHDQHDREDFDSLHVSRPL